MSNLQRMLLLAVAFAILLSVGGCSRGPEVVVSDFYRALEDGDLDGATELVSDAVIAQLGNDKFRAALAAGTRKITEKGGINRIEVLRNKTVGQTADLKVKIHYGDGTTETEDVGLIREDGDWKLAPDK